MSASSKLSLKLHIDKTAKRVVFAEAGKETIDFLFSLLTLPVGTVVKLLSKQGMAGCFSNLYQSIEYVNPNQNKDIFLKPNAVHTSTTQEIPLFFLFPNSTVPKKSKYYLCSRKISSSAPFHHFVTENPETGCPLCSCLMTREVQLVGDDHKSEESTVEGITGGIVKGVDTYMVMDDLVVKPMSTISSTIALLKKLKVKDVEALEEKVVDLNIDMALKLLKMAFLSKEVLTSVFFRQVEVPSVKDA